MDGVSLKLFTKMNILKYISVILQNNKSIDKTW